ncbi:response regulator transcription factor [Lysinibacillus fusiformis]|uniref:response regulator transcription factor n=1 Tax=Lysinibacillus fusiformis TaxID=28031 RepID=UPI002E9E991A|nr:response regulator transcription factor [Lysinibacillus fusiformis]
MIKIVVVEDEQSIRALINLYLTDEGYKVIEMDNAKSALDYIVSTPVDLVITDIMMPGMDGYLLCKEIRHFSNIPMLMITAKSEQDDLVQGFKSGTDDYLTKPFDPVEMVLRVKSLLRRANVKISQRIQLGKFELNRQTYTLSNSNYSEVLPLKEFELLFLFATNINQVFTRNHLLEKIWGYGYEGTDRTIDVHIRKLRERLEKLNIPMEIITLRGIGYRLGERHE